ncbi:MAG: hypothetical protein QOI35_1030, partial [Cryptosporangiaceae bacterium]|nr:hypothetical protein [Cryptosporangiaceae bacterium]
MRSRSPFLTGPGEGPIRLLLTVVLSISLLTAMPGISAIFSDTQSVPGNSLTSSCFSASVNTVQSGTATNTANGTQTVTITSVDTTKAFLQFTSSSNLNRPVGSSIGGRIATATTIQFIRSTDEVTPATITIRWTVTEYTCGVRVQRGSTTQTAATTNVGITPVASRNQAFFTWSKVTDASATDYDASVQTAASLASPTNLQFRSETGAGITAPGWYNTSWSYRKLVTVDSTKVGTGGVSGFPVLVSVTDPDLVSATGKVQSTGNDILFTDSDGTTKLSHEIESFNNTTGTLVAWVKLPTVPSTADTLFYLYYGNGAAASQQNVAGVFTDAGVWHLNQTPSTSLTDSSPNGNTGTPQNMAAGAQVSGLAGGSLTLDGTNDYISTTSAYTMATMTDVTVEGWVKTTTTAGTKVVGFENAQTGTGATHADLQLWLGTDGKPRFGNYTGSVAEVAASSVAVNDGIWHYLVGTRNSGTNMLTLYVDGTSQGTSATSGRDTYSGYLRIGSYSNSAWASGANGYFAGSVDEVRVKGTFHDAAWITTNYNSIKNPSTFLSWGNEDARWYNTSWMYRKRITIDNTKVDADLTNFPVEVSLTDADLPNHALASGNDILFTASDGMTKLDHEIETYTSATGALTAWVEVPTVYDAVNSFFWMYYGNPAAASQQNATGVWNSQSAWHLDETPAATLADSSSSANNGTPQSMAAGAQSAGVAGGSLTFDGTNDYASTTSSFTMSSMTTYTLEAWFKTTSTGGYKFLGFEDTQTGTAATTGDRQFWVGTDGKVRFGACLSACGTYVGVASSAAVNDGNWHQIAVYRAGGTPYSVYVDGVLQGTGSSATVASYTGYLRMGSYRNAGANWTNAATGYFNGSVDEVRLSPATARAPEWIKAEYKNISSPATFYSVTAEQRRTGLPATIYWEVVEFTNAADVWVQHGTTSLASGSASVAATIASVDLTRTFAQVSFSSSGSSVAIGRRLLRAQLTSATALTITRDVTGDAIETIDYQVVELREGSRVQSGLSTFANATATAAPAMTSPLDTTRATVLTSTQNGAGSSGGSGAYVTDDIVGVSSFSIAVTNSTTITLTRANTSGISYAVWFVVEWGGPRTFSSAYAFRRALSVTTTTAAPTGYTLSVTFDHASLVAAGDSLASGDDVRIARWTGSAWTELDRVVDDASSWNANTTKVWFASQAAIAASTTDQSYYAFYGNPSATSPPASQGNVYLLADGFESGAVTTNWAQQTQAAGTLRSDWYNANWSYRKTITIDHTQVSSTLTNFPVGVSLTSDANIGAAARADGFDVMFTSSDGLTAIPYERETFSIAGSAATLLMWVKLPSISNTVDTTFFLYYGNSSATDQSLQNGGPTAVWDANFAAVYHLNEATAAGTYADSTSNARNGTFNGTGNIVRTTGQLGGAQSFDGVNDKVDASDFADNITALTVTAWAKKSANTNDDALVGKSTTSNTPTSWSLDTNTTTAQGQVNTGSVTSASDGTVGTGTWNRFAMTFGGSSLRMYLNLSAGTATATGGATIAHTATPVRLGSMQTNGNYYQGELDEVRISTVARSTAWLQAEYYNQMSGSTFLSAGTETASTISTWYSTSWNYRKQITIDHTQVPSTLTNFPVGVSIASDANIGANARADGYDVVFTSSDGLTAIPYERETFSVASGNATLMMWVKLPSISNTVDTTFYLYYGNASATDQSLQNGGPTAVWDANFAAVYHLNEASAAGTYVDSTSNGRNGTFNGTGGLVRGTGRLGGAQLFDGTNDNVDVSDFADNITTLTVSAWINKTTVNSQDVAVSKSNTANTPSSWDIETDSTTPWGGVNAGGVQYVSDGTASASTWAKLTMTFSSSSVTTRYNGNSGSSQASSGSTVS